MNKSNALQSYWLGRDRGERAFYLYSSMAELRIYIPLAMVRFHLEIQLKRERRERGFDTPISATRNNLNMAGREQIGKNAYTSFGIIGYRAGTRKWLKRQSAKLMRRLAKYLDDAPKRLPFSGYDD